MSKAARVGAHAPPRPRLRISVSAVALTSLALGTGLYYAVCGLLIHMSFHSYGWDLGIFDQVLWSIGHGHGFHYSFRDMPYLGDHFQPVLLLMAPLVFLKLGAAPILVVQGLAFGAAVIPLHAAMRRIAGGTPSALLADGSPTPQEEKKGSGDTPAPPAKAAAPPLHSPLAATKTKAISPGTPASETRAIAAAWGLSAAYVVSLGVARAVSFDFHPECFVPLLAFTALWGLAAERPGVFVAATLGMLPIKEDAAFLVLGLCWVAWLGFGQRKPAQWVALASAAYFLVISMVVMREIAGGVSSPLTERYPYLGHSASSIFFHAITRPDLIADHLWNGDTPRTLLYLFAGTAFLPLLRPKLLAPLVLLLGPPFLAVNDQQRMLELHYGVAPYAYTFVVAAMVLEAGYLAWVFGPTPPHPKTTKEPGDTPGAPGMGLRPLHLRFGARSVERFFGGWRAQSESVEKTKERSNDGGELPAHPSNRAAPPYPLEKREPGDTPEAHGILQRRTGGLRPLHLRLSGEGRSAWIASGVVVVLAIVMFAWKSPLPPSFAAHLDQFDVDHHSDVAETFVDMVPGDAVASAQASFVPHLSQRRDIFEFPRITPRSTIVLIDDKRYVPGYDAPAYDTCRGKLPSFGFAMVRAEDGIELWERSEADAGRLGSDGCG